MLPGNDPTPCSLEDHKQIPDEVKLPLPVMEVLENLVHTARGVVLASYRDTGVTRKQGHKSFLGRSFAPRSLP